MTEFKPITIDVRWFNRRRSIMERFGNKLYYFSCPGCNKAFQLGDLVIRISGGSRFYYHIGCAERAYIDLD